MNQEEISLINKRHINEVDKLYRMHGGLSSELIGFSQNCIHLKISVSKRWDKSKNDTALQLAESWRNNNKELSEANKYEVSIFDGSKMETVTGSFV